MTDTRKSFFGCREGNFGLIAAILMPVALLSMGGGVNYSVAFSTQSRLQASADAAALAAGRELYLANTKPELLQKTIEAMVAANFGGDASRIKTRVSFAGPQTETETAARSQILNEVTVDLSMDVDAVFPMLGFDDMIGNVSALATARVSGGGRICMIALSEAGTKAVDMSGNARILADSCAVYSNSVDKSGVAVTQLARLSSELTCSSGGYSGLALNYTPKPLTDCPIVADPLISRVVEEPTHCDFEKLQVKDTNRILYPGTYCGDTKLTGNSNVVLLSGTYTFWNGKLKVGKGARMDGEGISLVFVGKSAGLEIKNDTEISLSASQTGAMAGILIFADRHTDKSRKFKIESRNARKMVGTIYVPNDKLTIGGDKDANGVCDPDPVTGLVEGLFGCQADVGQYSEWTAIVAAEVEVTAGVKLVLNTDYAGSTVPVPAGVGPVGRNIALYR